MSDLSNQAQKLLGRFSKTVDVMKSAYSKRNKMMFVWADDLYAVEAVMSFLETIRDAPAQGELPPLVDRTELIALLVDLASVNLSHEACERQARRMADDLIARGLTFASVHSGQKIADIEVLQQKLEFAEWEWNRATEGMKERDAKIALLESRVERLQDILRSCVGGAEPVDIGNGEIIGLHLPNKASALSSRERSDG